MTWTASEVSRGPRDGNRMRWNGFRRPPSDAACRDTKLRLCVTPILGQVLLTRVAPNRADKVSITPLARAGIVRKALGGLQLRLTTAYHFLPRLTRAYIRTGATQRPSVTDDWAVLWTTTSCRGTQTEWCHLGCLFVSDHRLSCLRAESRDNIGKLQLTGQAFD